MQKAVSKTKIYILLDQGIVSGGTLFTQVLIAQSLGMALYGKFSAIVLVQLFLLSIQQAALTGMYQVLYPSMNTQKRKRYFNGVCTIELYMLTILIAIGLLIHPFFSFGLSTYDGLLGLLNIILFLLQDFFRRVLLTNNQIKQALVIDILNNGLQVLGLGLLVFYHVATFSSVLLVCGLSFLPAIVYAVYVLAPQFKNSYLKDVYHHHGIEALWMTGSALLQWFAGNFYVVTAGWLLGPVVLGALRLGQYLFGVINVLLQAIESYLLPKAGATSANPSNTILYLKKVQGKMFIGIGLLLAIVVVAARPAMSIWKIENPQMVLAVIYGMSAVYVLITIGYPVRIALRTLKLSRVFFSGYIINAVFGCCTAYLFVHWWNLNGVLAGLFFSQVLLLGYWIIILQRKYSILWK